MSRSWLHFNFSGVIPRILRVRQWRGQVEGKEEDNCFFSFLLLSALLESVLDRLPKQDVFSGACPRTAGVV